MPKTTPRDSSLRKHEAELAFQRSHHNAFPVRKLEPPWFQSYVQKKRAERLGVSASVSSSSAMSGTSAGSTNSNTFLAFLERKRAEDKRRSEVTLPVIPSRKQRRQLQVVEEQQRLLRAKANEYNRKLPDSVLAARWAQRRVVQHVNTAPAREKQTGSSNKESVSEHLQKQRAARSMPAELVRERAREILQNRLKERSKENPQKSATSRNKRPIPRFVTHTPRSDSESTDPYGSSDDGAALSARTSDTLASQLLSDGTVSQQFMEAQRNWKNRFFEQVRDSTQQRKLLASAREARVLDNGKSRYLLQALT